MRTENFRGVRYPIIHNIFAQLLLYVQIILCRYANIIKYNGIGEGSGLIHIENSDRPHFWYVVFADCHNKQRNRDTLRVEYILDFTNPGGKWSAQFSYDEQGTRFSYTLYFFTFIT